MKIPGLLLRSVTNYMHSRSQHFLVLSNVHNNFLRRVYLFIYFVTRPFRANTIRYMHKGKCSGTRNLFGHGGECLLKVFNIVKESNNGDPHHGHDHEHDLRRLLPVCGLRTVQTSIGEEGGPRALWGASQMFPHFGRALHCPWGSCLR
jgi:hypothetical protein